MFMEVLVASTSIHFPEGVLEALDRAARGAGMSRNRLVVEACRSYLASLEGEWPDGFFDDAHLTPEDRELLRASETEFTASILATRRSRSAAPF